MQIRFGATMALAILCLTGCAQRQSTGTPAASAAGSPVSVLAPANTGACQALYSGGPGDDFKNGVVLQKADNESSGVSAEHEYVKTCLPGWKWQVQALVAAPETHRPFDIITLESPAGQKHDLYFDITSWFGKL